MKTLKERYSGKIYADEKVLKNAPVNKKQGELEFFNLGKYVSCDELGKEYESRGLIPADVYALASWNEEHKDDERKYFATQWKDADGNYCYAAFDRWGGERYVDVGRDGLDWDDYWWFAGVRKSSTLDTSALSDPLSLEKRIEKLEAFEKQVRGFLILD